MNQSSRKQAWVVRAGWVGVLSAMSVGAGAAFGQFDEPVLTEIVFSKECDRRTFM